MSRIGKLPIQIPANVKVDIAADGTVTVKGPKGTLSEQVKGGIQVREENGYLLLTRRTTRHCTACTVRLCTTWSSA